MFLREKANARWAVSVAAYPSIRSVNVGSLRIAIWRVRTETCAEIELLRGTQNAVARGGFDLVTMLSTRLTVRVNIGKRARS